MKTKSIKKLVTWGFLWISLLFSLSVSAHITNLTLTESGSTRYQLRWDWSSSPADSYLIILREGGRETTLPVDGQSYSNGQSFGGGKVFVILPGIASDNITPITGFSFNKSSLANAASDYWFTIYPYDVIGSSTSYRTSSSDEVTFITPGMVEEPMAQASNVSGFVGESNGTSRTVTFSFDKSPYELSSPYESRYLIVAKVGSEPTYTPTDGSPNVTGTSLVELSDGSMGRLDEGTTDETWEVNVTNQDQTVFFKVFSLNKAQAAFSLSTSEANASTNYLVSNPLSFIASISAEPNRSPTLADATFTLNENASINTEAGQVTASDLDGDVITYAIVSGNDAGAFTIGASSGSITVTNSSLLDFETTPSFFLEVQADDGNGGSVTASITINLSNVNDIAPTISAKVFAIDENSSEGSIVGQMTGSDEEGDVLSYSISSGNDAGAFSINSSDGTISVANSAPLDFETTSSFTLEIQVSDGVFDATANAIINLNDVQEASAPTINDQTFTIIEPISTGDDVGTVEASDAQGDNISYTITNGNTNNAFGLDASSGVLTVSDRSALDFVPNAKFDLTVNASDGSDSNEATITIILNNAPEFNWTTTSFQQNESDLWTIEIPISDAEGDELALSIESGNTNDLLDIFYNGSIYEIVPNGNTGIDFEEIESFEIVIEAMDFPGNVITSDVITINITNLNDNAPETSDETININQNLPNGTQVITIAATDVDGDALTFSITGGNIDGAFAINSNSGEITVSNGGALNFAINPTFNLVVLVTDGVFSVNANITINLNETTVNTSPIIADQNFTIEENSENGTSVGNVIATDNEGDNLSFAIVSGNTNNAFLIASSTGEILVIKSEELDFETNPIFTIIVSVSDGNLTEVATITIELTDVDETITALDDNDLNQIAIYPNPTSNYFSVQKNELVDIIHMWDQKGQLVSKFIKHQSNKYDIGHLRQGIYFIRISSNSHSHNSKIVIK